MTAIPLLLLFIVPDAIPSAAAQPSGSLEIDFGAEYTTSRHVTLSPAAEGADGAVSIVIKPPPDTLIWMAEEFFPGGIDKPFNIIGGVWSDSARKISWWQMGIDYAHTSVSYKFSGAAGQYAMSGQGNFGAGNLQFMGDRYFVVPGSDAPGPVEPGGPPDAAVRTCSGHVVTIQVSPPPGSSFWEIEEYIPEGAAPSNIMGPGGFWDEENRTIGWQAGGDAQMTLSYELPGAAGMFPLDGIINLDGARYPIVGGVGTFYRTIRTGVLQMRFSNDGESWSDWEDIQETRSWTLTAGNGLKTVYAEYRDVAGAVSTPVTAAITLAAISPEGEHEGEVPEGEPEGEREGEVPEGEPEGEREGEAPEGEPEGEREGEVPEGEIEGEADSDCGCPGCRRGGVRNDTGDGLKSLLSDWLLIGLSLMALVAFSVGKGAR